MARNNQTAPTIAVASAISPRTDRPSMRGRRVSQAASRPAASNCNHQRHDDPIDQPADVRQLASKSPCSTTMGICPLSSRCRNARTRVAIDRAASREQCATAQVTRDLVDGEALFAQLVDDGPASSARLRLGSSCRLTPSRISSVRTNWPNSGGPGCRT